VAKLAEKRGFAVYSKPDGWHSGQYFRSCLVFSVAVVDVSLEGDDEAYRQISILPSLLDHVLLVSRTPLPLNLVPLRRGGAPPFPYPRMDLAGLPPLEWGNAQILAWVEQQLDDPSLIDGIRLTVDEADRVAERTAPELYARSSRRWSRPVRHARRKEHSSVTGAPITHRSPQSRAPPPAPRGRCASSVPVNWLSSVNC
jgi:hypothetical protein